MSYYVKQDKQHNFCKYTISRVISICNKNSASSARLCWLIHDSVLKYSKEKELFRNIAKFYLKKDSEKDIRWYYNVCIWIGTNILEPPIESKEIMNKLNLEITIKTKKLLMAISKQSCEYKVDEKVYYKEK